MAQNKPKQTPAENLQWAISVVQAAHRQDTYGKLTLHYEKGRIVRIVTERSLMPSTGD